MLLDELVRHARRDNEIVVNYVIFSSYEEDEEGNKIDDLFEIDYYDVRHDNQGGDRKRVGSKTFEP